MKLAKMGVSALAGQELFMGAFLDDAPAVEDDNAIRKTHCAETVGDDQRGASGRRTLERIDDSAFGDSIQTAGRLVENQNGRVAQHGAGYSDALLLPPG